MQTAEHLEGLRTAAMAFARYADRAGLDAPVPTCPGWSVRDLVAHQGDVHRWAVAHLRGRADEHDREAGRRAGRSAPDPLQWLRDGTVEFARAVSDETPAGARPLVFLAGADPGRPREFWARRQCHETTIHAVDALSAALGRFPTAAETWIDAAVARDGIDELLTGFLPQPRSRLRAEEATRLVVRADDDDGSRGPGWLVEVSEQPPTTTRLDPSEGLPAYDVVLAGGSVELYLTLWNRSDEHAGVGGDWDAWRAGMRV
ncbi:maleylpyruvate isomerase family mycothiol-dependent enzyme [Nocardioides sp. LHG3406-4]|uniref:maleylpyruvate isomerase family mycothiol-dependent enzyme n=1 Tax=Nocardioides sp. LHG3406-4 TaxID=2804575 RepID=UPI003CECC9B7